MKTEARLQQDCFMFLWNNYPQLRGLYFEIQNTAFSARSGMMHKAIGRISGVADNCLLIPYGHAIFFEFKSENGKQSSAQKEWQEKIEAAGYTYYLIKSFEQFESIIKLQNFII